MKKIKVGIIITIIAIVFLIIAILVINNESDNMNINILNNSNLNTILKIDNEIELTPEELEAESQQGIVGAEKEYEIIKESDYVTLEKCIIDFLSKINKNSSIYYGTGGQLVTSEEEIRDGILKLLSENYISKNNITKDNVDKYIYNINNDVFFIPTEIMEYYKLEQVNSFVIEGFIGTVDYVPIMKVLLILNMDITNNTYSIEILDNNQAISSIIPTKLSQIQDNNYNSYRYAICGDKEIINELMYLYKRTILGYPEVFYNKHLNNEYKQQKFKNLEKFKKYVEINKEFIKQINIKQYNKIEDDENITYILEDQYQNILIISYKSIVNYNVYLDYYTVKLDYFKEIYDNNNTNDKVGLQINKFKQMINFKDYNYIYNKLNQTFKNNNFSSVESLETYLKSNTYEINDIEINDIEQQDNYYVCKCTLINRQNKEEKKDINIIIKLIDYSNFELSFSI